MTFMQSLDFVYDGKYSQDLGIVNVTVASSGNLYTEDFVGKRTIKEMKTRGNPTPYKLNVDYDPIEFVLELAFINGFTDDQIKEVSMLLVKDDYKPLFFTDNPDRIFYCMPIDSITMSHNGFGEGYLTVKMRCNTAYSFAPVIASDIFDTSTSGSTTITIANNGHVTINPEIWITKVGNGNFTIINDTDGGKAFTFTGLIDGETVYVDNQYCFIQTSLTGTYRYNSFNNNYLNFLTGNNKLEVTGNATFQFRYQFKLLS